MRPREHEVISQTFILRWYAKPWPIALERGATLLLQLNGAGSPTRSKCFLWVLSLANGSGAPSPPLFVFDQMAYGFFRVYVVTSLGFGVCFLGLNRFLLSLLLGCGAG